MASKDSKFKKGQKPWNKGLKGIHLSPASEFKEGMIALNKKTPLTKVCKTCSKIFMVKPSLAKVKTCSKRCGQVGRPNKFKGKTLPWSEKLKGKRPNTRAEKNHRWIADRTQLKKDEYRNCSAHREWSKQIKNRDYWKCQISNDDCSGRVEAHHILSWRDYPELRFELKNGITLCHFHHPRKREDEKRLAPIFKELVSVSSVNFGI